VLQLATPPLTFSFHHHHNHTLQNRTQNINNKILFHSFTPPKSSLLSSPTISTLKKPQNASKHFHNLCNTGNLNQAFNFLQSNLNNVVSSSNSKPKQLIGLLLQSCGHYKNIEIGRKIHNFISTSPHFQNDVVLITRVVTMYSICDSPCDSLLVFNASRKKNMFLWNALLSGYLRNNLFRDVVFVFVDMISLTEFVPDNFTLSCVIKACVGVYDVKLGEAVHGFALKTKVLSDVFVGNALIAMYGEVWVCGECC
jgi:pentatricopeptide repeat protein